MGLHACTKTFVRGKKMQRTQLQHRVLKTSILTEGGIAQLDAFVLQINNDD